MSDKTLAELDEAIYKLQQQLDKCDNDREMLILADALIRYKEEYIAKQNGEE